MTPSTQTKTLQQAISAAKDKATLQPLINQWFKEQRDIPVKDRHVPFVPLWYCAMFDSEAEFDLYLEKYFDLHYFQTGKIYLLIEN